MKKICSKCKEEKDISEFPKRKNRPSGVYSFCKNVSLFTGVINIIKIRKKIQWLCG